MNSKERKNIQQSENRVYINLVENIYMFGIIEGSAKIIFAEIFQFIFIFHNKN